MRANRNPNLPVFSHLVGWKDFLINKNEISGLHSTEREIIFEFSQGVGYDLLAYLSLSDFGYYCLSNFNDDGAWADNSKIISSGPFKLKQMGDFRAEITQRPDWPLSLSKNVGFNTILFSQTPEKVDLSSLDEEFVFIVRKNWDNVKLLNNSKRKWRTIQGVRHWLTSLVVTHKKQNVFRGDKPRKNFSEAFVNNFFEKATMFSGKVIATSLYPEQNTSLHQTQASPDLELSEGGVYDLAHMPSADPNLVKAVVTSIQNAIPRSTINIAKIYTRDKNATKEFLSNEKYDFRLVSVVTSLSTDPWIVEMMFCGNLGVSFPDPYGRVCKLVSSTKNSIYDAAQFARELNRIVKDDATVIPLLRYGFTYIISDNINPDSVSQTASIPIADLIEIH